MPNLENLVTTYTSFKDTILFTSQKLKNKLRKIIFGSTISEQFQDALAKPDSPFFTSEVVAQEIDQVLDSKTYFAYRDFFVWVHNNYLIKDTFPYEEPNFDQQIRRVSHYVEQIRDVFLFHLRENRTLDGKPYILPVDVYSDIDVLLDHSSQEEQLQAMENTITYLLYGKEEDGWIYMPLESKPDQLEYFRVAAIVCVVYLGRLDLAAMKELLGAFFDLKSEKYTMVALHMWNKIQELAKNATATQEKNTFPINIREALLTGNFESEHLDGYEPPDPEDFFALNDDEFQLIKPLFEARFESRDVIIKRALEFAKSYLGLEATFDSKPPQWWSQANGISPHAYIESSTIMVFIPRYVNDGSEHIPLDEFLERQFDQGIDVRYQGFLGQIADISRQEHGWIQIKISQDSPHRIMFVEKLTS